MATLFVYVHAVFVFGLLFVKHFLKGPVSSQLVIFIHGAYRVSHTKQKMDFQKWIFFHFWIVPFWIKVLDQHKCQATKTNIQNRFFSVGRVTISR